MSRFDGRDIMIELIELSRDVKSEILQQLNYYRASVYKHETAAVVEKKIEQLRWVGELIGDAELLDAFQDYEAMKSQGPMLAAPGECLLSLRTMALLGATDRIFSEWISRSPEFSLNIQKHRRQLLALCQQGSRQWAFFSTLEAEQRRNF